MNIICIGDSITAGYGVSSNKNWVSLLNESLDHTFINKGINGDTSTGLLMRCEKDMLSLNASICLIMIGINDIMRNTSPENVIKVIEIITKDALSSNVTPVIISQPPINSNMASNLWDEYLNYHKIYLKQIQLNNLFENFCHSKNILFVDVFTYFKNMCNTDNYHLDGIHLNLYGNRVLADFISQEIKSL